MTEIPIALFALPPLALAAGVDLYLTLLLIGAAPTTGLWDAPLPGALGDLDSPGVLIMVGTFYLLEFTAERFSVAGLAWNAFHALIRPVSGILLALLVLDGQPLVVLVPGALLGGALTSVAHAMRTGGATLRWLRPETAPSTLLVSLAEDAVVVGVVALTLDATVWAAVVTLIAFAAVVRLAPSLIRAFAYAVRLLVSRIFRRLHQRRWRGPEDLPELAREAFGHDEEHPPGAVRWAPVGAWRFEGAPRFAMGWIVVRSGEHTLILRRGGEVVRLDLGRLRAEEILDRDLYRRIDVRSGSATAHLLFGSSGPNTESLRGEFEAA